MAPRLKVFVTSDGLTDFAVATTSKAKALAAWGVRQDLFKEGLARETDEADLAAQARARPGEVLRRPAGTRAKLARAKPPAPPRPKAPSTAALKKVSDLEAELAALDAAHAKAEARFAKARADLDRQSAAEADDHRARRTRLEARLSAARGALGPG